jgi:molecular chaperone DnaK
VKSDSKHIQKRLTRKKLEELTRDLIEKSFPFIEKALDDCKLEPEKIDDVILVGGQTRMPLIRNLIAGYLKKKPKEQINPDEIVAMGAAIQSGILGGKMTDLVLLLDVTPLSLGIEAENDQFVPIIEKNTTIPTKKTRSFTTVEHDQRRVRVHVLQGEEDRASENMSLARFDLVGIESAPAGVPQIDVTFEIDADGLVKVSAKDIATGRAQRIDIKSSSGLSGEQIDKIIKREHLKKEEEQQ